MAGWKYHARFTVYASASVVLDRINPAVGIVEAIDDETCVLEAGSDSLKTMAVYVGMLGLDFTVTEPPELIAHLAEIANRYHRAVSPRADAVV
jgi:predicted DNA-binding transcriptional regulator YafY